MIFDKAALHFLGDGAKHDGMHKLMLFSDIKWQNMILLYLYILIYIYIYILKRDGVFTLVHAGLVTFHPQFVWFLWIRRLTICKCNIK